jgi:hypothetical protein
MRAFFEFSMPVQLGTNLRQQTFRGPLAFHRARAVTDCYDSHMSLPFVPNRFRAYEIEFGAGGQRLGCKFLLDDGSLQFVNESEITTDIETLIASLGPQTAGLTTTLPITNSR